MSLHESSEPSPTQDRFNPDVPQDIPDEIPRSNIFVEDLLYTTSFADAISALSANPHEQTTIPGTSTAVPPSDPFLTVPSFGPTTTRASIPRMSSFPPTLRPPEMMPLLKQKGAPAKFTGHHEDVKPFIDHFNQLAATYSLTDAQKCKKITIYCSRSVIDLLEALS